MRRRRPSRSSGSQPPGTPPPAPQRLGPPGPGQPPQALLPIRNRRGAQWCQPATRRAYRMPRNPVRCCCAGDTRPLAQGKLALGATVHNMGRGGVLPACLQLAANLTGRRAQGARGVRKNDWPHAEPPECSFSRGQGAYALHSAFTSPRRLCRAPSLRSSSFSRLSCSAACARTVMAFPTETSGGVHCLGAEALR